MSQSEYNAWVSMRQRCLNPRHAEYFRYGERGIGICPSWDTFNKFFEDMGNKPHPDYSLDRKDNNQGYSASNCVWASKSWQSYNQRVSIDNYTGVTGVSKEKQTGSWKAYIRILGKQITLGRFKDFFEAVCTRKSAEIEYYKDFT